VADKGVPDRHLVEKRKRPEQPQVFEIEVMTGLKEGDQIVTGTYQVIRTIKNDTQVKVDNKAPVQTKT